MKIPAKEEIPKWVYSTNISFINKDAISNKALSFDTKKWKYFKITDLFNLKKGERLVQEERIEGKIPLITATSENNGIVENISYEDFKDTKKYSRIN